MSSAGVAGPWRAVTTLLAGGLLAQALPLLLGPLITRLCAPDDFGQFTAFAAVATNLAVVACARYEFALPLERDDAQARQLFRLCLRLLLASAVITALMSWPLAASGVIRHAAWLAPAVAAAGILSLMTLWAMRAQAFRALAVARVLQHGGGALVQLGLVALWPGAAALIAGPPLAAAGAAAWLWSRTPAASHPGERPSSSLRDMAQRHRDFPLLNTPHAFVGALGDTLAVFAIAAWAGDPAVGLWGLALRYLKAPATLVGGAVSQVLYPRLGEGCTALGKAELRRVIVPLALAGGLLGIGLMVAGPWLFAIVFGESWRGAGELARALGPYIALHFVSAPLAVVTMAWRAQAWALRLALVGQCLFLAALVGGLAWGGLVAAGWAVSAAMVLYFGWYLRALLAWRED